MNNNEQIESLNIQPQAGVIGVFSRLNYKPWYAIAEFVDNSTQSFYSHENELLHSAINTVEIRIDYNSQENILTIVDTAYGMELSDFKRAVKVDSPPEGNSGRNEFGMGLKTAASWFGEIWSVESTQLGSTKSYRAEVNIPLLRVSNANSINIHILDVPANTHGTTITIKSVTKRIDSPRTKSKIKQLLESMYRRDLNDGKVMILFDGEPLHFDNYDSLRFRDKIWRKDLDFSIVFNDKNYHINGFVGILANGGFGKAGFALFRRGRVVIGGEDQNYKPERIFGQSQSPIAHKLFGELDLDDFPVNQAKDGFVWDDGLEDVFIEEVRKNIKDYIDIAKMTNKERAREESLSEDISNNIQQSVQQTINDSISTPIYNPIIEEPNDLFQYINYQNEQKKEADKTDKKIRKYKVPLDPHTSYEIGVQWTISSNTTWINIDHSTDDKTASVKININHPFFKPFSENEEFKVVLEKFAIAFALAEIRAKSQSNADGLVLPGTFRNFINEFLKQLSIND